MAGKTPKPKRRRRRYTAKERERALGMLAASEVNGRPRYSHVAEDSKVPRQTLQRWWQGQENGQYRAAAAHARKQAAESGSLEWLELQRDALAKKANDLLEGEWTYHQPIGGKEGGLEVVPMPADRCAQTMVKLTVVLKDFAERVLPQPDDDEMASLEEAIKRANL